MSQPIPAWGSSNVISMAEKRIDEWKQSAINYVLINHAESPLQKKMIAYVGDLVTLLDDGAINSIFAVIPQMRAEIIEAILGAKTQQDFEAIKLFAEGLNAASQLPVPDWISEIEHEEVGRLGN